MHTLKEEMAGDTPFLIGVELLSTRASMSDEQATWARQLASELASADQVNWVSITDNAGGNPTLSPVALGKPLLYAGKEVVIHLSCKDFNRNGLESVAWQLASEGFHNILALSGDYPVSAYGGGAKPVFDIDAVGLLKMLGDMNRAHNLDFFLGAVASNFKLHENEVMPQYLKLEKKLDVGAKFIISQIGFDARKSDELRAYMEEKGYSSVPLVGNVFLLSQTVARFFQSGRIPGVVLPESLFAECQRHASSPDKGRAFFLEFAAKQVAILRGLGYRGAYLGGLRTSAQLLKILEIEASYSPDDWKQFARDVRHSRPGEFFYFAEDPATGLADRARLDPEYETSRLPGKRPRAPLAYRFNKWMHRVFFDSASRWSAQGRRLYERAANPDQGPFPVRAAERLGKSLLFGCRDCGDCSLPDIAFLCPESVCAKNQRNGPCGGTRDGQCEVDGYGECIWAQAYDRLKHEGRELDLLEHSPVVQDQSLRGTSAWGNHFLGKDHHGPAGSLPSDNAAAQKPGEADTKKNPRPPRSVAKHG